jgi:hypothetical protein
MACSPFINWLLDHFSLLWLSTNPNMGWQKTWKTRNTLHEQMQCKYSI